MPSPRVISLGCNLGRMFITKTLVFRAIRKYHFGNNLKRTLHTTTSLLDEEKSYYEVLGLEPTASSKEIKTAYLELSKKLHPDANPGNPEAATRFHIVSGAYGTLSNSKLRRMYDKNELGRMSSVADRESSTHSFDGAGFVEVRLYCLYLQRKKSLLLFYYLLHHYLYFYPLKFLRCKQLREAS